MKSITAWLDAWKELLVALVITGLIIAHNWPPPPL